MRAVDESIIQVREGKLLLSQPQKIECLTVYKTDGTCVMQKIYPEEGAIILEFLGDICLIVVNLIGGRYFTNIVGSHKMV